MKACSRAEEVRQMVMGGLWPVAADDELRAHVRGCSGCSVMALITLAMRGAREADVQREKLEPAGLIWWRAQLRKRREAVEQVSRPMWRVQAMTVGASLVVAVALLAWMGSRGGWQGWLGAAGNSVAGVAGLGATTVLLGGFVLVALGGVAVYFLVEREG